MFKLFKKTPTVLFILFSAETFTAAVLTLWSESASKNALLWGRTLDRWLLAVFFVFLTILFGVCSIWVGKNKIVLNKFNKIMVNPWLHLTLILAIIIISTLLIVLDVSDVLLSRLLPVILCFWAIGMEILLFCRVERDDPSINRPQQHNKQALLALISIVCLVGAVLLPANIPGLLDGIPWDTSIEFVFLAAILPFSILINWRSFSKTWILIPAIFLFIFRLYLFLSFPSIGLDVRAFKNEGDMKNNRWVHSYETLLNNSATLTMKQTINQLSEFPWEWVNDDRLSAKTDWLGLNISGFARLDEGERLIFILKGGDKVNIQYIDLENGKSYPALISENPDIDQNIPDFNSPAITQFQIEGTFEIKEGQENNFRPLVIDRNGKQYDPFKTGKMWNSSDGLRMTSNQFSFLIGIMFISDIIFILTVLTGLLWGTFSLFKRNLIGFLDIYLAVSAGLIYVLFGIFSRMTMNVPIQWVLIFFLIIKAVDSVLNKNNRFSQTDFNFAIFPIMLAAFLCFDMSFLRQLELLPRGQDSLEYQMAARRIYIDGDFFLKNTPPRAYKILFPYLAGLMHILFGQSLVSLFYLNDWAAALTASSLMNIFKRLNIPRSNAYLAVIIFFCLLTGPLFFIFYFRFGLIEPVATLCLVLLLQAALDRKKLMALLSGALLTLFRLDYIGAASPIVLFFYEPLVGSMKDAWLSIFWRVKQFWKWMIVYEFSLIAAPLSMILFYFQARSGYELNAVDTKYTSLQSIIMGLLTVVLGGRLDDIQRWMGKIPGDYLLLIIVLVSGTILAGISLIFRFRRLQLIDMRLGLVFLGFFGVYIFVSPTGYAPRFSTPLLPLALIMIFYSINQVRDVKPTGSFDH